MTISLGDSGGDQLTEVVQIIRRSPATRIRLGLEQPREYKMVGVGEAGDTEHTIGGNFQRPTRNRRATEKSKNATIDDESDTIEIPSTPKKAKTRGRSPKSSEPSNDLFQKLIEMITELREEMK